ncbi:MAG: hypothetical protein R3D67_22145 [Hyphomicrobiaceae bacterium]
MLATEREHIYSREVVLGSVSYTLQAVGPAQSAHLRHCRVSVEFPEAAAIEVQLDRLFPLAQRTAPTVQRLPAGKQELISITAQWLRPRKGVGAVGFTVEVLGQRRKATLTAVPDR